MKSNQKIIWAEKYQGLYDTIVESETVKVGRKVILLPTIYGSPRLKSEAIMDSIIIVRKFEKPDYFITFTTNPKFCIQISHICFTWNSKDKKWQRQKRGVYNAATMGLWQMGIIPSITLNSHQAVLYYLRMLLHNKAGALGFEDLRTVNGNICRTFQEACQHSGLLEDDSEIDKAMEEAA